MRERPADSPGSDAAVPAHLSGCARVIIERVEPEIDAGRFPIKRSAGEWITVTVDMFADGHDLLAGVLQYRIVGEAAQGPTLPA